MTEAELDDPLVLSRSQDSSAAPLFLLLDCRPFCLLQFYGCCSIRVGRVEVVAAMDPHVFIPLQLVQEALGSSSRLSRLHGWLLVDLARAV